MSISVIRLTFSRMCITRIRLHFRIYCNIPIGGFRLFSQVLNIMSIISFYSHSAEILCAPDPSESVSLPPQTSSSGVATVQPTETKSRAQARSSQPSATPQESHQSHSAGRASSTRTTKPTDLQTLPANYVALYPYKPKKSDELELKKGGMYYVYTPHTLFFVFV